MNAEISVIPIREEEPLTLIGSLPGYSDVKYVGCILLTITASNMSTKWTSYHRTRDMLTRTLLTVLRSGTAFRLNDNEHVVAQYSRNKTNLSVSIACGTCGTIDLASQTHVLYVASTGRLDYYEFTEVLNNFVADLKRVLNLTVPNFLSIAEWKEYCAEDAQSESVVDNACVFEYDVLHLDPRVVRSLWQTFK